MNLFTLMAELSLDTSKFDASAKRAIADGKQIGDAMTGVSAHSEKAASAMEEIVSYQPPEDVRQAFLFPDSRALFTGPSGIIQIDFNR